MSDNTKKTDKWQLEWTGMPEFIQNDKEPVQKIIVSFETREDVERFADVTGYKITPKTKSLWFPYKEKDKPREWVYIDE